jgi:hypothetical protein
VSKYDLKRVHMHFGRACMYVLVSALRQEEGDVSQQPNRSLVRVALRMASRHQVWTDFTGGKCHMMDAAGRAGETAPEIWPASPRGAPWRTYNSAYPLSP